MANTEIVDLIVEMTAQTVTYMLPIIGTLAGITFIVSFLFHVLFTETRRNFR